MKEDIDDSLFFFVVCCNGFLDLLNVFLSDQIKLFLKDKWICIYFIYIVFVFYNFEMMYYFIKFGVDVNL